MARKTSGTCSNEVSVRGGDLDQVYNVHCSLELFQTFELWDVSLRSEACGHDEEPGLGRPAVCSIDSPFAFFLLSMTATLALVASQLWMLTYIE